MSQSTVGVRKNHAARAPSPLPVSLKVNHGPYRVYLIVACAGGFWQGLLNTTVDPLFAGMDPVLVGAVIAQSWSWATPDEPCDEDTLLLRNGAVRAVKVGTTYF